MSPEADRSEPKHKASILGNFLYSSLTTVLSILIPLITYPYLARVLGPDNMGRFGVASSFTNYFVVAAGLGFATYGVRAIASARKDRLELNRKATELLVIAVTATLLASIAFFAAILLVPRYRSDFVLFAFFGVTVLVSFASVDWIFRGIEEFRFIGLRNAAIQVSYVGVLFLLVRKPSDTLAYAGVMAGFAVIGAAVNLLTIRRYISLDFRGIRPGLHVAPMALFAVISFAITAYTNLDFLFLGLVSTAREAGLYSVSLRLARMVTTVTATLSGVLLPRLSLLAGNDEGEYRRLLKASASAILLFALPSAVGIVAVGEDLVLFFGGPQFSDSVHSLRILAGLVPVVALSNFLQMQLLIPRRRERGLLLSLVLGFLVTGVAMVFLVKPYGHIGAAWGMLAGELTVLVVQAILCREELGRVIEARRIASYCLGAVICGAAALLPRLFLGTGIIRLVVSVAAGVAAYAAFLFAIRDPLALNLAGRFLSRRREKHV
jgi:O-antigen/teichoic acid export membrane protein